MHHRIQEVLHQTNADYTQFRLSEILMHIYKLIWDDYCANYLEMIKPAYGQPIDADTYNATLHIFQDLLKLLHPFLPFITEELWQNIEPRKQGEFLMLQPYPATQNYDKNYIENTQKVLDFLTNIRNLRAQKQLSPKDPLDVAINVNDDSIYGTFKNILIKLANIGTFTFNANEQTATGYTKFMTNTDECYINLGNNIDITAETQRLQKEIDYQQGFLDSVTRKLSNQKFVENAPPQVLENERKKQADAQSKIKSLTDALDQMNQ
jgi:valyl-tRNA synthetase